MAKDLQAAVETQKDAQQKRPVLLFELGLSSTIRFAASIDDVVFPTGGNTYTAKTIHFGSVSQSAEGTVGRVTVKFDNVSRDMAAYLAIEPFKNKSLVIKRVYRDAMGSADNYVELFRGTMEAPRSVNQKWLTVSATFGKPLNRKLLGVKYQRQCPWKFGDTDTCGAAVTSTGLSAVDSGTTTTLRDDSALTQSDDYWNHGRVEITKDGVTYYRMIADFDSGTHTITFDAALSFAVDNTCNYRAYKGCDKTWDTCGANNAWGPNADNQDNFGGCLHIKPVSMSAGVEKND